MTGLMDRLIAIDPCLVQRSDRTYGDYEVNEGLLRNRGDVHQLYGPNWHAYKEKACKVMKDTDLCERYFAP